VNRGAGAEIRKLVGRCVAVARIGAGLTQEEAAAIARIDYKRWQTIERGAANPTVDTLSRIASAFGIGFFELVGPRTLWAAERARAYGTRPRR